MKLYGIKEEKDNVYSLGEWTTDIEAAKEKYNKVRDEFFSEGGCEDDKIELVVVGVDESWLSDELEDHVKPLQKCVLCVYEEDGKPYSEMKETHYEY